MSSYGFTYEIILIDDGSTDESWEVIQTLSKNSADIKGIKFKRNYGKSQEKFLKDGAKLKAFVFFKGRSIIYKDQGEILLLKLAQELEEFGKVEQLPKLESKKMIMIMSPKKSK